MHKSKRYAGTRFRRHAFAEADEAIRSVIPPDTQHSQSTWLKVWFGDEFYKFDTVADFLSVVEDGLSLYHRDCGLRWGLEVFTTNTSVRVDVWAPTKSEVNTVFAIFEKYAPESKLSETLLKHRPMIFIGHGADPQWRDLKNELHEQQGYEVAEYAIGDKGARLRDALDEVLQGSTVALLILTGDEEVQKGKLRARENLIYEAGSFVGKLGFGRVIVLLEEGAEEFSNIFGIHQIRYQKGRLREAVGDVVAVVKRDFEA